ncbi:hypothetical protein LOK49_LG11G00655 [Camellia lanceoleosa]|uniref:Uncharacterized protein n=1 Tax=Camellia lanceoleosa TaxID=1840588 RepID=A0ACC0G300_9ERIC|nr:hypothetical protein LOK49_LG11G00655 [Camellia lanceoleosa]
MFSMFAILSFTLINLHINDIWNLERVVFVYGRSKDFFLFFFEHEQDMHRIAKNRPYAINGALLVVDYWKPDMIMEHLVIEKMVVWVKLFGLPLQCFMEEAGFQSGKAIGEVCKVDHDTLMPRNIRFIRIRQKQPVINEEDEVVIRGLKAKGVGSGLNIPLGEAQIPHQVFHRNTARPSEHLSPILNNIAQPILPVMDPINNFRRGEVWSQVEAIITDLQQPFIIMGDLNQVRGWTEKLSKTRRPIQGAMKFNALIFRNQLVDLPSKGISYTWSNN